VTGFEYLLLGLGALVGSTLAAVTGFGGAALLLPILSAIFGVRDAVPILTVAQLIGNASRVVFNRRDLVMPIVGWYSLGAVPFAILGGLLFATAPLAFLNRLIGVFLLAMVVWRHAGSGRHPKPSLRGFAVIGGATSFLSALVGGVGPILAPFFLAYGLVKGAYIGTEALATVITHTTKLAVYGRMALISQHALLVGLAMGPIMITGSWLGKRIVDRLPERVFVLAVEAVMILAGFMFLFRA
jgi:uncharacterized protein